MAPVDVVAVPAGAARRAANLLVGATGVSAVGDGVTMSASALLAAAWTSSAVAVAAVTTLGLLASGVSALVGGVYVDRWDRRRALVVADVVRAVTLASLAFAVVVGWRSIAFLALCTAVAEAVGGLFVGAAQAIVPALVGTDGRELERVNGRVAAAQVVVAEVAGQPLGGALYALAPAAPFAIDAVSFAGSAALLRRLPRAPATIDDDATTTRAALRSGVRFIRGDAVLCRLLAIGALTMFGSLVWTSVLVLIARDRLHASAIGFGLLLAAVAVGAAVGSALAARVATEIGTRATVIAGLLVEAFTTLALAPVRSAALAALLLFGNGVAGSLWPIVGLSLRQRRTPDRLLGRVSGAHRACTLTAAAVGGVAGGALATTVGYGPTIALAALPISVAALVAWRLPRRV